MIYLKKIKFDNDTLDLIKHSKNYVSSDLLIKALALITIPIFTRLLIPSEYGMVAIFNSFVTIFAIIFNLGMNGSITRYFYEDKNDFGSFIGSNFFLTILWSAIVTILLLVFEPYVLRFFAFNSQIFHLSIFCVWSGVILLYLTSYLQAAKKSILLSKLNISKAFLIATLSITLVVLMSKNKYMGIIYSNLFIGLIFSVYSVVQLKKVAVLDFNKEHICYSMNYGLPLVVHGLSGYILNTFDQVIINQLTDPTKTGLYSFAYNVGMLQYVVTWAILKAYVPIFYEKMNKNDTVGINLLVEKYVKVILLLALFLSLFAREIVMMLADNKYFSALPIVPIIIMGYVFSFFYVLYVQYAFYYKRTKAIALFTLIAGGCNIALNYWLIPIYGYFAAAYNTAISFIIFWLLHYLNVKIIIKECKETFKIQILLQNAFCITIAYAVYLLFDSITVNIYFVLIIKFLLLIFTGIIFFRKSLLQKLFDKKN